MKAGKGKGAGAGREGAEESCKGKLKGRKGEAGIRVEGDAGGLCSSSCAVGRNL